MEQRKYQKEMKYDESPIKYDELAELTDEELDLLVDGAKCYIDGVRESIRCLKEWRKAMVEVEEEPVLTLLQRLFDTVHYDTHEVGQQLMTQLDHVAQKYKWYAGEEEDGTF